MASVKPSIDLFLKNPKRNKIAQVPDVKTVYLIGSFKFYADMLEIQKNLAMEGIRCFVPQPSKHRDPTDPSKLLLSSHGQPRETLVKDAYESIIRCFRKIDECNIIYVVNKGGYIGKSTLLDIGYAYARKKPIYALETVDDLAVQSLLKTALPSKLVRIAKEQ